MGMDIGRKKDLSVIWILEKLGNVKYSRMLRRKGITAERRI